MDIHFDPKERAQAKEDSRRADARALASGAKSHTQLISENAVFHGLGRAVRVNLRAARRLI